MTGCSGAAVLGLTSRELPHAERRAVARASMAVARINLCIDDEWLRDDEMLASNEGAGRVRQAYHLSAFQGRNFLLEESAAGPAPRGHS